MSIKQDQIKQLYANAPLAIFASICIAGIVTYILFGHVPERDLFIWCFLIFFSFFLRIVIVYLYKRSGQYSDSELIINRWLILYQITVFITGFLWGSSVYFSDYYQLLDYRLMITAIGFALAGGATVTLGVVFSAYLAFTLPMLLLITISMFLSNAPTHFESAWLILIGIVYSVSTAYRYSKNSYDVLARTDELNQANIIILQQADSLDAEVKKRSKELLIARDEAIQANKAKSDFLANMSHELRTPMHGILGFVNMGIDHPERLTQHKVLEYLGYIKSSADRLMGLLNDLLDLAKLESGKMEMEFKPASLQAIVINAISEQQVCLEKNYQQVIVLNDDNAESNIGNGIFDEPKIAQVITNLLSNAIKFSPKSEKIEYYIKNTSLPIEIKDSPEENKTVPAILFSMRDHGKGISEQDLLLIFDKFHQGFGSQIGTTKGTGLGLPICKEIIALHRGKIQAENHPDGGALFSFIIPVKQTENDVLL